MPLVTFLPYKKTRRAQDAADGAGCPVAIVNTTNSKQGCMQITSVGSSKDYVMNPSLTKGFFGRLVLIRAVKGPSEMRNRTGPGGSGSAGPVPGRFQLTRNRPVQTKSREEPAQPARRHEPVHDIIKTGVHFIQQVA